MPHFILKSHNGTKTEKQLTFRGKHFKLSLFENIQGIWIYLGGHSNIYSLECYIYKDIEFDNNFIDKTEAFMIVYYDQACSLDGDFDKGIDPKSLIHLFLSYIKNNYKHVTRIQVVDEAVTVCDKGCLASLSTMLYVRTGKTWFEEHFGGVLEDNYKSFYDEAATRFREAKEDLPWRLFVQFIKSYEPLPPSIEKIYNETQTLQQFFITVADTLGDYEFCEFVSPWLDQFMNHFIHFKAIGGYYHIHLDTYEAHTYEVEPYTNGRKKKFTMRLGRIERAKNGWNVVE